ncbi:MAG: DUF4124 domain-containing protein [Desulfuromonadales bacterium]|nr:MAG: DUF4124 domain-containing protein [Desulfuromonadales bacterium]
MRYLCAVLLLTSAVPSFADIYKWVDERGVVSYTEDLGKVPVKYRKKVTVITDAPPPAAEVTETVVEQGGKQKKPVVEQKDVQKTPVLKQEKKTVYGGKDEAAWKAEFDKLRSDIKVYEGELAERKAKIANPGTMSRGEYLGLQTEVKRIDEKLADLNGKLNALKESAQKAGVPAELRK